MPLHNSEALVIETDTAAESLPDPTTVNGRTHLLQNTGTVTAVWSSVGATPFQVGGVNVATVSIPRGQNLLVQSDGVRWVSKSSGQRSWFAGTAVTNASGDAVFTFPVPFAVPPIVTIANETPNGTSIVDLRITSVTTTGCTIRARQSIPVVVLAVSVYALATPLVGATIHIIATPPGQTP